MIPTRLLNLGALEEASGDFRWFVISADQAVYGLLGLAIVHLAAVICLDPGNRRSFTIRWLLRLGQ